MKRVILIVPFLVCSLPAQVQIGQREFSPPQDQTGQASIEGTVINAITREPVKKASVMLNGRVSLNVVTDSAGHFAFRQLPAGQFTIQARSEKYPPAQFSLDAGQQLSLSLTADEHKQDLALALMSGASVRGRIADEDGNPMPRCMVSSMLFRDIETGRVLQPNSSTASDEKGEYRILNLPPGKYYILARCNQTVPLPHAFISRKAVMDAPMLIYPTQFYPGVSDLAGAARVEASPGADISGINLRMSPVTGVTVRGHIGPVLDRNTQLLLERNNSARGEFRQGARLDAATGEFRIQNVLPGSYELIARASVEGRGYFAKVPVEVGATPPDPIDVTLAQMPIMSGTVSIDGEVKTPVHNLHVTMNSLDGQQIGGPPPQAEVQADGTFTINSVPPGHWRLYVNGAPGYLKSVTQGDQEISAENFEVGTSGGAPLKIVIGTKFAQVEATLAASSSSTDPVSAIIWRSSGDPRFQQNFSLNTQGSTISIAPGHYYACAFAVAQPWMLLQNRALRKELESRCESVDAPEGGRVSVLLPLIPAADLKRLVEKLD